MRKFSSWAVAGVAAASCLVSPLASLAQTPPAAPSLPFAPPAPAAGVYSVKPVSGDTVDLVLKGHKLADRTEVERYLLYRAATHTLDQKKAWFLFARQPAAGETPPKLAVDPNAPARAFTLENFQPVWRYQVGDQAWKTWSPYSKAPFLDGVKPETVTAFEVSARVTPKAGTMPASEPLGFEAAPLAELLTSRVKPPE